jgi:hypothetical protein
MSYTGISKHKSERRIQETIRKAVPERMVFLISAYLIAFNSFTKIPVYTGTPSEPYWAYNLND